MMRGRTSTFLLLILLTAEFITVTSFISVHPVRAVTWSSGTSLTPLGSLEDQPYVIEDSKSNLWVAYESSRLANFTIWMRQYNSVSWLPEQQLTSSSASGASPALVQLANGNVMLVWSSNKAGNFSLYYKTYAAGTWSNDIRLTAPQGRDSTPTLSQLRNGTLLLYWTRETLPAGSVVRYIFTKTYNNGTWSPERQFTTGGTEEESSVFQADDGTIWNMYSANRFGNLDVFYKTYNGVWSPEFRLTTNTADDYQPWIMQDLNGTMWAFWTRCIPTSGQTCEQNIFYETSTNKGVNWSPETQFTTDPTGCTIQNSRPAAIHYNKDKMMYVFWGTDLTNCGADYDVWVRTSNPIPFHDVSASNATAGPNSLMEGGTVKVNATANNPGSYNETVSVNAYYQNATSVLFKTMTTTIKPGASAFVQMSWNTSKAIPEKYELVVIVLPVPGESTRLLPNNSAVAGNATVLPIAEDLDKDGRVDILDVARVAGKFGMQIITPDVDHDCDVEITDVAFEALYFGTTVNSPNWNPQADVDHSGKVDILDVALVANYFGQSMGPEDLNHDCVVNILDVALEASFFGWGT
jgi:hypothetical protein